MASSLLRDLLFTAKTKAAAVAQSRMAAKNGHEINLSKMRKPVIEKK